MRKWRYLVIHHSDGPATQTVDQIREYHVRSVREKGKGFSDIGYHYLLQRDAKGKGHLKRGRPDTRDGAHAGVPLYNRQGIGLCVIGSFGVGGEQMSEGLYQDALGACLHLLRTYGIAPENVLGHRDVKATQCPGDRFPLARLKVQLKQVLS